ncbi:cystathionine beta-lyase [Tistrella bauzanensis]|uniref:Cystathionine beta-lyase n=1 Tax=Tistrella arctica TaxID=3133430 RepID=A0ABU9YJ19_9PROT
MSDDHKPQPASASAGDGHDGAGGRFGEDTRVVHVGRDPFANHGIVNPPVHHASTVLFPTLEAMVAAAADPTRGVYYGRYGTPITHALEDAYASLAGGRRGVALASGKTALMAVLAAFTRAGDHVVLLDNVYEPTRALADQFLGRYGVDVTYADPMLGADIATLFRPNTRLLMLEAPGSLTFEVPDLPAMIAAARTAGVRTALDNSWATPLYLKPLAMGVDVVMEAGTKYLVGHSDAMLGVLSATDDAFPFIRKAASEIGAPPGPDDCYLALRGLRTLSVRMARHQETGLTLARHLAGHDMVSRVLHPALPDCPGHDAFLRDFKGASGLFAIELVRPDDRPVPRARIAAMVDDMVLFKMGFSWGGFESLVLPVDPRRARTATRSNWEDRGPLLRIHAGLEDPADLIADLDAGLARYAAAG